jgi:hypothetical protein
MKGLVEIRDSFNLKYNNINSGGAPGLNDYEISMYLTEAQKQVLDEYYCGTPGKRETFELTERSRVALAGMVETLDVALDTSATTTSLPGLSSLQTCLKLGTTDPVAWRLLSESVRIEIEPSSSCNNGRVLNVEPVALDEIVISLKNPFKRPDTDHVFRVDTSIGELLVFGSNVLKTAPGEDDLRVIYTRAFLRFPKPLILVNLEDFVLANLDTSYELTIDGEHLPTELPLPYDDFVLDVIISRAVVLATKDYKENTLAVQAAMQAMVE